MMILRSSALGLSVLLALAGCPASEGPSPDESTAGAENTAGGEYSAEHTDAAGADARAADVPDADTPEAPTTNDSALVSAPPDVAAPPDDAERTASGLASRVITPGDGTEHPTAESRVTVHYSGWTTNGHMFDSSITRGRPASFPLSGVIAGWTEGLQLMVKGETRRFWIPANLAYGENPRPGAPLGMLVFDVQLIDFAAPPSPPTVPEDVSEVPADAERTATGLASRVITAGDGTEHPTAESRVTVHYSGWTTDGEMFDSSVARGRPATFPLSGVIAGWTEGLQLMVKGETRRFWIPANLAYGDNPRPGAPRGMLVFDVQLIDIH